MMKIINDKSIKIFLLSALLICVGISLHSQTDSLIKATAAVNQKSVLLNATAIKVISDIPTHIKKCCALFISDQNTRFQEFLSSKKGEKTK